MFDYTNLSSNEFEMLCSDILSRELGVELRHFSPGRDGGVDLTESPSKKEIVVQVKHYVRSSFSGLKSSLSKELVKVEKMQPKPSQYYICTSKELMANQIKEIYNIFSDYMSSDKNIFSKYEVDKFLSKESNQDILKKNFKLWLLADKVLTQLLNRDVFIDGEVLLDNLEEDFKYFVQTNQFDNCLEILLRSRKLLICGDPGVGKSITSKMLTFYFVKQGYQIRYTTNGLISDLKKSLQENKDLKEVILLDDCLGQYYLKLKQWQDDELISLMNYITLCENKILILNSRITVLNEAEASSRKLRQYFENEKLKIKRINMNKTTVKEKSLIFYNHLRKNNVPDEYYNSIRKNRNYVSIVNHKNYNPRIIEYITHKKRYTKVGPEEYFNLIFKTLNNPEEVWADEFKQGLGLEDRIFMHTIFSLTDTLISLNILEECFVRRIQKEAKIDNTINIFEEVKIRLNSSMIRIVDDDKEFKIGVLNPSINDFMQYALSVNKIERENIVKSAVYIEQIEKVLGDEAQIMIYSLLETGEILKMKSITGIMPVYIFYLILNKRIMDLRYKDYIREGLLAISRKTKGFLKYTTNFQMLFNFLTDNELFVFYKIDKLLEQSDFRHKLILNLSASEIRDLYDELYLFDLDEEIYYDLIKNQKYELENYIDEVDLYDFIDSEELDELGDILIDAIRYNISDESEPEINKEIEIFKEVLKNRILDKIDSLLIGENFTETRQAFTESITEKIDEKMDEELDNIIQSYIYPEPDDDNLDADYPDDGDFDEYSLSEVDIILDRDITT